MGYTLNLRIRSCSNEKQLKFVKYSHKLPDKISTTVTAGEEIPPNKETLFVVNEINNQSYLEKYLQQKLDEYIIEEKQFSESDLTNFQYLVIQFGLVFYYVFYDTGTADTCCIVQLFPNEEIRVEGSYIMRDSPKGTFFEQELLIEFY